MRFRQHQAEARASTTRLLLAFGAVVLALVLAVNAALALLLIALNPFGSGLPPYFVATNTALVLTYVLGGWWIESSRLHHGGNGARCIAQMLGAREAQTSGDDETARRERRFLNVVHELALAARMAPPTAWVLPRDDAINALAAGWGDDDAHRDTAVIVTRGALERLTREELQGVVAHELSHIQHGDTRLNMQLVGMVWGLQLLWMLGRSLSDPVQGKLPATAPIGWVLLAVGWLGWLAGRLLQAAVSRQREFLADATAVKSTRQVAGLGGALRKIADQAARHQTGLSTASADAVAHLLLASPFDDNSLRRWLATHPPLSQRLRRLYGREVVALDDAVLAAPHEDALPGVVALHGAVSRRDAAPSSAEVRHDVYQHASASTQDREVRQRIERWSGPGQWQAAALALCAPCAPGSEWRDAAWQALTADLPHADAVRADVSRLDAAGRRWARQWLLTQARRQGRTQALSVWRAAIARARRQPMDDAQRWTWMALRHALGAASARPSRHSRTLQADVADAATRCMGRWLAGRELPNEAFFRATSPLLIEITAPAPAEPRGLAPLVNPVLDERLALRLRHLAPMRRPQLVKAWVTAAAAAGMPIDTDDAAADVVHWVCLALDIPHPQSLRVAADPIDVASPLSRLSSPR